MTINDLNMHNLQHWYDRVFEIIQDNCQEELSNESKAYKAILDKCGVILEQYLQINTILDCNEINKPITFSIEELKAFSEYLVLDSERTDLEAVQMYLLGCRHTLQVLELIKII